MRTQSKRNSGFTLIELLVVVAIIAIVSAMVVPNAITSVRNLKLNGAVGDYANLLQQARLSAVRDNRTYQVHAITSGSASCNGVFPCAYIDIYPKQQSGPSGQGSYSSGSGTTDPLITFSSEVATANTDSSNGTLKTALGNTSTIDTTHDPTFGPRGTPCTPTTSGGGVYCPTDSSPVQFFTIFQSSTTGALQAVTVDGAGRVQRWYYSGSSWATR